MECEICNGSGRLVVSFGDCIDYEPCPMCAARKEDESRCLEEKKSSEPKRCS